MPVVELNIDLAEQEDEPARLFALATTVNLACGAHAGHAGLMARGLRLAKECSARVAAHPGYADRQNFGRRARAFAPALVQRSVFDQCQELARLAEGHQLRVDTVKAHGALYHDATHDADYAAALLDGARAALPGLRTVVGPPRTALEDIVIARGLRYEREGFADRRYEDGQNLVPRSRPDALLTEPDQCLQQALWLARVGSFDTLCMHGDTPNALQLVSAVAHGLAAAGLLARRDV